jgi:hypothetical protein
VPHPTDLAPAIDHFVHAIQPCLVPTGFDHARAVAAVDSFVRELRAAGEPPSRIVTLAGELATPQPELSEPIWRVSLPAWVRTTAHLALEPASHSGRAPRVEHVTSIRASRSRTSADRG